MGSHAMLHPVGGSPPGMATMDNSIHVLSRNEGPAIWFLNTLTLVKATSETTSGAFALVEQLMPAGFATPYHLHHREDEAFYVLEGGISIVCDGRKLNAGPGAYFFGPRKVPHGFRVEGSAPARILVLTTPAGFERFLVEMSEPATILGLPQPSPIDEEKLLVIAAKYEIDILGPLPG